LLAVLIVGSFVIPMVRLLLVLGREFFTKQPISNKKKSQAQYFWYVKDDDSTDKFFAQQNAPEPKEPAKKKGWF